MPERVAQAFGLSEAENEIIIEHFDDGISSTEIPYISALWSLKNDESKRK